MVTFYGWFCIVINSLRQICLASERNAFTVTLMREISVSRYIFEFALHSCDTCQNSNRNVTMAWKGGVSYWMTSYILVERNEVSQQAVVIDWNTLNNGEDPSSWNQSALSWRFRDHQNQTACWVSWLCVSDLDCTMQTGYDKWHQPERRFISMRRDQQRSNKTEHQEFNLCRVFVITFIHLLHFCNWLKSRDAHVS